MDKARTDTERIVAEIVSDVLKTDGVGLYDEFLDLGGHSLSATLCINRIKDLLAVELSLETFLTPPAHVAGLAAAIEKAQRARG